MFWWDRFVYIEYTKQIATCRALDATQTSPIAHHRQFCKANRNMVPGVLLELKYVTSPNGRCTNLSHQKNMAALESDVTSAVFN